jgi:hypothetical protein
MSCIEGFVNAAVANTLTTRSESCSGRPKMHIGQQFFAFGHLSDPGSPVSRPWRNQS